MSKGSVVIAVFGVMNTFRELVNAISATMLKSGYSDIRVVNHEYRQAIKSKPKVEWGDINIVIIPSSQIHFCAYPPKNSVKILIMTEQQPIKYHKPMKWDKVLVFFPKIAVNGAEHFPLGYSTQFDNIEKHSQVEIRDTYFFGSLTNHRLKILKAQNIHYRVRIWGKERDALINTSKLNVNLSAFNKPYCFAPIHALLIICKGKFLLQENCHDNYDIWKPYIKEFTLTEYQKQKKYWLECEEERLRFSQDARKRLKNTLDFDEEFIKATKGLI